MANLQDTNQPVAWRTRYKSEPGMIGHYPWTYTERAKAVACMSDSYEFEPLYTHPAPVRQPLTEDDIAAIGHRMASTYTHRSDPTSHAYGFVRHTLIAFARAIESAHEITAP